MQVSKTSEARAYSILLRVGTAVFGHQERMAVTGGRKRLSRGAWVWPSLAAVQPAPGEGVCVLSSTSGLHRREQMSGDLKAARCARGPFPGDPAQDERPPDPRRTWPGTSQGGLGRGSSSHEGVMPFS